MQVQPEVKIVTVGIAVVCSDGIVIGADRKVTMSRGTRIKSLEEKVYHLSFRDGKNFLMCIAGSIDHAKRALAEVNPANYDSIDCGTYREWAEGAILRLRARLADKGLEYNATLLFGMINIDGRPVIGHITPSGLVELKYEGYFTSGIAAPYAEIVLKDTYSREICVDDAKLIICGLIKKIGEVDNDVEGVDVYCISSIDEGIDNLTWAERQAVSDEVGFSLDLKKDLDLVRDKVGYWDGLLLDSYSEQQKTIEEKVSAADEEEVPSSANSLSDFLT